MSARNLKVIVRLPNWVGDVVMTLPALQAMQQIGIELLLFGKPWAKQLLAATQLPFFPLEKQIWQTVTTMARLTEADKALLFTNSFSSALMTRLARKSTIGYQTDARRWLLQASLPKPPALHEVQYFWEIARFATQHWFPHLPWPQNIPDKISLPLSSSALTRAQQILQKAQITTPFWVLCPFAQGAGKNGQSKIWPHWRELSHHLRQHHLVVCPAPHEEPLCTEFVPDAQVLSQLNLEEYAAIMAQAECIIANDSGPMHMAAAVNHKSFGIFGVSAPERTRPWGGKFIGREGHYPSLSQVLACINDMGYSE